MSKTITLRISEDHYEALKKYAQTENRKISNAIETLAMKELENTLFTDSFETEGILSDENLLGRIKAGVKQALALRRESASCANTIFLSTRIKHHLSK